MKLAIAIIAFFALVLRLDNYKVHCGAISWKFTLLIERPTYSKSIV